ncbi:MAG: class I SAM-dependent methyltransferase [Verrucomicrobiales bacterium]
MGFDRVAKFYRGIEKMVYGGALQEARIAHLEAVVGEPSVLLLGDGDGRFLEALLARVPGARVDVVESSAKMIELAEGRVPAGAAVEFHHSDITEFAPDGRYDLVVSHFFLDCFQPSEVEQIIGSVAVWLGEGGIG